MPGIHSPIKADTSSHSVSQSQLSSVSEIQHNQTTYQDIQTANEQEQLHIDQEVQPRLSHGVSGTSDDQKKLYQTMLSSMFSSTGTISSNHESNRIQLSGTHEGAPLMSQQLLQPNIALQPFFSKLTDIQVEVMSGANTGNESSTFDLIKNLRSLGYQGHITVLAEGTPQAFSHTCQFQVDIDTNKISKQDFVDEFFKHQSSAVKKEHATLTPINEDNSVDITVEAPLGNFKFTDFTQAEIREYFVARTTLVDKEGAIKEEGKDDCKLNFNLFQFDGKDSTANIKQEIDRLSDAHDDGKKRLFPDISSAHKETLTFKLKMSSEGHTAFDKLEAVNSDYEKIENVTWAKKGGEKDNSLTADPKTTIYIRSANDAVTSSLDDSDMTPNGYLQLQPFQWHSNDRFISYQGSRIDFHTNTEMLTAPGTDIRSVMLRDASYTGTPIARQDYESQLEAYEKQLGTSTTANLSLIFVNVIKNEIGLMTAYGLHQAKGGHSDQVMDLMTQGLVAVGRTPSQLGVNVMLVSYSADDLKQQFTENESVEYLHVTDTRLAGKIQDAKQLTDENRGSKLFVIHANGLPQPVFQMAIQESTFPILTEGANTMGQTLSLGKELLLVNYTEGDVTKTTYPDYNQDLMRAMGVENTFDAKLMETGRQHLLKLTNMMYKDEHTAEDIEFFVDVLAGDKAIRRSVQEYSRACSSIKHHPVMDQTSVGLLALAELKKHVMEKGPVLDFEDQQKLKQIKARYTEISIHLSDEDRVVFERIVTLNPNHPTIKRKDLDEIDGQIKVYQKTITEQRAQMRSRNEIEQAFNEMKILNEGVESHLSIRGQKVTNFDELSRFLNDNQSVSSELLKKIEDKIYIFKSRMGPDESDSDSEPVNIPSFGSDSELSSDDEESL